jgi:hypothetical protein
MITLIETSYADDYRTEMGTYIRSTQDLQDLIQ